MIRPTEIFNRLLANRVPVPATPDQAYTSPTRSLVKRVAEEMNIGMSMGDQLLVSTWLPLHYKGITPEEARAAIWDYVDQYHLPAERAYTRH